MKRMQSHLFTLVLFFRLLAHGAELLMGPQSQNVVLGETATFTCIGNSSAPFKFMSWRFNGSALNSDNFKNMNFSMVSSNLSSTPLESNLSFTALSQYNNSIIQCTFFEFLGNMHDNDESELAYLRIQGLLNSVIDLNVQYSLPETLLSWTAPFTLEGLSINYDVTITDESSGTVKPVVTLTDTTQYIFSTTELIACHSYSFTIQTRNSAGGGNISSIEEFFPGGPVSPSLQAVTVVELTVDKDEGNVNAVLTFPITTACFDQQNITVTVQSHDDTYTTTTNINNQMEVSVSVLGLPVNVFLSVELTLSNSFGKANLTGISINTHSVQRLEVVQTNSSGSTCFRCTFVNNTLSTGCLITLKLESSTSMCTSVLYDYQLSLPLSASDDANSNSVTGCIDGIYAGMYTVEAYDTDPVNISKEAAVSHVGVLLKGLTCVQGDISSTDLLISITSTTSLMIPKPTINSVDKTGRSLRTAGILIGVFSGLVIIVLIIMISVLFYNRCHSKGGVLRITVDRSQSTPIRTERVSELSSTSDSPPQLLGIQSYESTNKFLNYPPTLQDITVESTVQSEPQVPENMNEDYNKEQQYILMQTTIRSGTGSVHSHSTNSSSSDLAPRTKYGSGDYDHLLYDEDEENTLNDVVVNTKMHQGDKLEFYIQESEVL